jgi:hypothetical protein
MSQSSYVLENGAAPIENLLIRALLEAGKLDPDGISGTPNYTFAWERSSVRGADAASWQRIAGATSFSYIPGDADVGFFLRAVVGYVDGAGNLESVSVQTSEAVANVNDLPTHNLRLVGNFAENGSITVGVQTNSTPPPQILDADNPGPIGLEGVRFAWYADNVLLSAEGAALALSQDEVGKRIEVRLAYTDARGTEEAISLVATTLVVNVNDRPTGALEIDGMPAQGSQLRVINMLDDADGLPLGANAYAYAWLANGEVIAGATQSSFTPSQAQVGKIITVRATYTDRLGTVESPLSAPTTPVENVNDLPVGSVRIEAASAPGVATTTAREDFSLRVVNAFTDADGLPASFSIRWQTAGTPSSASDWVDVEGARGASAQFTPGDSEVGQFVRALVRYTDNWNTEEEVVSAVLGPVVNVNDPASWNGPRIVGVAKQGETLSVSAVVSDADGPAEVDSARFSYQWTANGADLSGETGETLVLTQAHVGRQIRVRVSFTDDRASPESKISDPTAAVVDVDDEPTGSVRVVGLAAQGQTLSIDDSQLVDIDGPKTVLAIEWLADGAPISHATGNQLLLTQALVDKAISARLRYSDGSNERTVVSDETGLVRDLQDAPTGTVTVTSSSGQFAEKSVLTAAALVNDLDGLGDITWEWLANGQVIPSDGSSTLELSQSLVGARISARASYRDGLGKTEFVLSPETTPVTNVNDPREGDISIEGGLEQGRTLSIRHNISDLDGMPAAGQPGALAFQWLSNNDPISGATGLTFTPGQAQVGKVLGVRASYRDLGGNTESVVVSAAGEIGNVNDAPSSSLRIDGPLLVGATLTRAGNFSDPDGISASNLANAKVEWLVGGVSVDGANGDSLKLDRSMVGKAVTLQIGFTDAYGADETVAVTSATKVGFAGVSGPVYHWQSHVLMPGAEVLIQGGGQGLAAAAASAVALRGVGFNASGDLLAQVWLNPNPTAPVSQVSAKMLVSGPGAVSFTPATGSLPDSWASLSEVSHAAGGGELLIESSTVNVGDSVSDARLLGTIRVDFTQSANWARLSLEQANLGAGVVSPYAVTLGRDLSDSLGAYQFSELDFEELELQALLPMTDSGAASARAAITSADALAALKLVSGRAPGSVTGEGGASGTTLPPGASPYQFIAADVNRDGLVTADDANLIIAMAGDRPGAPKPEWVLVREDQGHTQAGASAPGLALSRQQAGFQADTTYMPGGNERGGWVAVLLGDVDGSWRPLDGAGAPLASVPVLAPEYFGQLNADLGVPLGQFGVV